MKTQFHKLRWWQISLLSSVTECSSKLDKIYGALILIKILFFPPLPLSFLAWTLSFISSDLGYHLGNADFFSLFYFLSLGFLHTCKSLQNQELQGSDWWEQPLSLTAFGPHQKFHIHNVPEMFSCSLMIQDPKSYVPQFLFRKI